MEQPHLDVNQSISQFIKSEATRLGFDLVGITSAEPPPHWSSFENWLAMGWNADMDYLGSQRSVECRADPKRILPDCKSIIMLGVRYPAPQENTLSLDGHPLGRIAGYARGKDYHLVLPQIMEYLVGSIESFIGRQISHQYSTDSGPVLERDLAQRAGLGWVGKNTCLINPIIGSYFLLSEIFIDLELEVDPPFTADRCGSCSRCLEACPTQALSINRSMDTRRCIAYLTIECKGPIPTEYHASLGDMVFGCDICQKVCPWNQSADPQDHSVLDDIRVESNPDLLDELGLSPQEFNIKYRETALMRTRRNRYLRNVIIALTNSRFTEQGYLILKKLENDPNPIIKAQAARAVLQWK